MKCMRSSFLLAACLCLPFSSCIVVAAGAVAAVAYGAVSYNGNEASATFQNDLETATAACRRAMRALSFPVDDTQQPTATECTLTGGDATVVLERHPGEVTKIRVRIGTFDTEDNRRRAGLLLEKIRTELG